MSKRANKRMMALWPAAFVQPNRRTSVLSMRTVSACANRQAPHQIETMNCSISCSGAYPRFDFGSGSPQPDAACRNPMPSSICLSSASPPHAVTSRWLKLTENPSP
jgi:hypothetical protein